MYRFLAVMLFSLPVFAEITFPVNPVDWAGRTGYLIVPTDTNIPYQIRYLPGESTPRWRNWPTIDGSNTTPPMPYNTVDGEPEGLVYPIKLLDPEQEPQYDSNLERVSYLYIVCGPFTDDPRQPEECGTDTDVVKKPAIKRDLELEEVLTNAENRAKLVRSRFTETDGYAFAEELVQLYLQAKVRQQTPPTWLTDYEAAMWQTRVSFTQNIATCLSDLKKKIRCKYDSEQCTGTQPVVAGDFDTCWPAVPEVPEL